jgi:hypothetical protein
LHPGDAVVGERLDPRASSASDVGSTVGSCSTLVATTGSGDCRERVRLQHRDRCAVGRGQLVARSTIESMTDDEGMTADAVNRPEPPSAKAVTALLREARSLSRRADKLGDAAEAVDDPATQQLATAARTSMEQLVHHLMVLERQVQRGEKAAGRRAR